MNTCPICKSDEHSGGIAVCQENLDRELARLNDPFDYIHRYAARQRRYGIEAIQLKADRICRDYGLPTMYTDALNG